MRECGNVETRDTTATTVCIDGGNAGTITETVLSTFPHFNIPALSIGLRCRPSP